MSTADMPPVGLRPRHIAAAARINEIGEAIIRYCQSEYLVPMEWVEEYNELLENTKNYNRGSPWRRAGEECNQD